MRMTPRQVETMMMAANRYFGADAVVWLFGSRVDDDKKGGDYDFLVETSLDQPDTIVEHKIAMLVELQSSAAFMDEKIDLIVRRRHSSFDMPIYAVAKTEGIRL